MFYGKKAPKNHVDDFYCNNYNSPICNKLLLGACIGSVHC